MRSYADFSHENVELTRLCFFFFSSRRRHTIFDCDWSSDVCSSDLEIDERMAVDLAGENRKVAAKGLDVQRGTPALGPVASRNGRAHAITSRIAPAPVPGRRKPSCRSTRERSGATRIREATSLAKA